ncbi:MAG TPA: polyprenol monophosphomannose synthase [Solirubrobacterales bacterium]|nr:polyprenol monophosphomannose synthase [Solirubrobacterales bacterium]
MTAPPRIHVVVPTYDEADNIAPLTEALLDELPEGSRVTIVDDSSPDGTGEIADRLAGEHPGVDVLHRPGKQGLGPAYVAGFRHVLAGDAELVVQMDADFSHDPADVPRLVAAARRADLVLGSRYVAGGRVGEWGAGRLRISRWGSAYARAWLGLGIRDLTGGFKCLRRELLESLELETMGALGYAFQVETTYRAVRAGFTVIEVPIYFHDRRVGESKMSKAIVAEAAWRVPLMRCRRR